MDADQPVPTEGAKRGSRLRRSLYRKYISLFVAVVSVALIANSLPQAFFTYQEHRASLMRIQRKIHRGFGTYDLLQSGLFSSGL
jgi:hypothetical protein